MVNFACLIALASGLLDCSNADSRTTGTEVVSLQIQIAGKKKAKIIKDIPYRKDMTILDMLEHVKKEKKIKYTYRGSNATAFLISINGVKNKGARGDNWIFRVNKNLGKKSFGITKLKAGDEVTWTFGKYRP